MGDLFKGDERAPGTGETTEQRLAALSQAIPTLGYHVNQTIAPERNAEFRADQTFAPAEQQLNADLFKRFAPQYANTQSQIDRGIDPEYYRNREQTSARLGEMLTPGLTPGELSGVERGLNQQNVATGNSRVGSNTNTVGNAMQYGNAARDRLGQALGLATNILPQLRSNITSQAISTPLLGQNATTQAFGLAGQQSGQIAGLQGNEQTINANRKSVSGNVNEAIGSCCFIFLESYNGKLPWWIRELRDVCYERYPLTAKGYKRMAKVLVPLMRRFNFIQKAVDKYMVYPITYYGGWLKVVKGYEDGYKYASYRHFWINVWTLIGKL